LYEGRDTDEGEVFDRIGDIWTFFCFSTQQGKDYKHLTEYLKKVMVVIKHSNKKKLRKE
jgi:hypothetical protein